MQLPNAENAFIEDRKLIGCCLSETHPIGKHKARVFRAALNYGLEDLTKLKNAILEQVTGDNALLVQSNQYGELYILDLTLYHPPKQINTMEEAMLGLLDVVVLTPPIPDLGLRKGELGTVVELISKDAFLVELADTNGRTYPMPALSAAELMKVHYEPA